MNFKAMGCEDVKWLSVLLLNSHPKSTPTRAAVRMFWRSILTRCAAGHIRYTICGCQNTLTSNNVRCTRDTLRQWKCASLSESRFT